MNFLEDDPPECGWVFTVMQHGMLQVQRLKTGLEGAVIYIEESLHVNPGSCALSWILPRLSEAHLIHDVEGIEDTFNCLVF